VPPQRMVQYRSPSFVSGPRGPLFELSPPGKTRGLTLAAENREGWGELALTLRFLCGFLLPVDLRVMLQPRSSATDWHLGEADRGWSGIDTFTAVGLHRGRS
jgi:hypothetical protein